MDINWDGFSSDPRVGKLVRLCYEFAVERIKKEGDLHTKFFLLVDGQARSPYKILACDGREADRQPDQQKEMYAEMVRRMARRAQAVAAVGIMVNSMAAIEEDAKRATPTEAKEKKKTWAAYMNSYQRQHRPIFTLSVEAVDRPGTRVLIFDIKLDEKGDVSAIQFNRELEQGREVSGGDYCFLLDRMGRYARTMPGFPRLPGLPPNPYRAAGLEETGA